MTNARRCKSCGTASVKANKCRLCQLQECANELHYLNQLLARSERLSEELSKLRVLSGELKRNDPDAAQQEQNV